MLYGRGQSRLGLFPQLLQAVVSLLICVQLPLLLLATSYVEVIMPYLSLVGPADHCGYKSAWCPWSGQPSSVGFLSLCRGLCRQPYHNSAACCKPTWCHFDDGFASGYEL